MAGAMNVPRLCTPAETEQIQELQKRLRPILGDYSRFTAISALGGMMAAYYCYGATSIDEALAEVDRYYAAMKASIVTNYAFHQETRRQQDGVM